MFMYDVHLNRKANGATYLSAIALRLNHPQQSHRAGKRINVAYMYFSGSLELSSSLSSMSESSTLRCSSPDSLFDECEPDVITHHISPPIPGLSLVASALSPRLGDSVLASCMSTFFPTDSSSNQIMLFGAITFPSFLNSLLDTLCAELHEKLPSEVHALLFPPEKSTWVARQAIINRYAPGEGISPHVDLLGRYGDGILGVSLGSGCAMVFERAALHDGDATGCEGTRHALYLPPLSVLALSGEARYAWTHGIERRTADYVMSGEGNNAKWVDRAERVSITFRWLLPGALVVGQPD
jgi:hypothetical protein